MPEFFTVDRTNSLAPGMVLEADHNFGGLRFFHIENSYTSQDLTEFARDLFPAGLMEHGKRYLLDERITTSTPDGPLPYVPNGPAIELAVELVRRASFPERPSRFSCAFGWSTPEEAHIFRGSYTAAGGSAEEGGITPIYAVSCARTFRADMRQLLTGGTILGAWLYATRYWRGEATANPLWEELLIPPVKVPRKVA